ncbi:uncharacterized protein LOC132205538 [Neocloeon triangulifer]|uniref:uncharacterized protein LOC132205538 n=1 Tax=Neocloeon triangulifer TaxID=2078957 RepID=UPI00286F6E04|nr:uncharacterized protein LOC132205538 [Neocloeon triangulifer]
MSRILMPEPTLGERCNGALSAPRIRRLLGHLCNRCIPAVLRRHHRVRPAETDLSQADDDKFEYLQLNPERRIRVIHHNPEDDEKNKQKSDKEVENIEEPSVEPTSDQYWFVRGSHCSYRLMKNKAKAKQKQLEAFIRRDSVRYSFHKKEAERKLSSDVSETDAPPKFGTKDAPLEKDEDVEKIANDLLDKVFKDAITAASEKIISTCRDEDVVDIADINISIDSTFVNEAFVSDEPKGGLDLHGEISKPAVVVEEVKLPIKMTAEEENKIKKPMIMFLHGAGSSAEAWTYLIDYFALAGYEVLAPDMLGHGFSSAPNSSKAYSFACLLQDALQIFDTYVTGNKKCVLITHGYGCSFGAAVTRYRPQSISQLVMISGGGPTPLAPPSGIYALPRFLLGCAKPLLLCGFRREYFYAPRGKNLIFCDNIDIPPKVLLYLRQGQHWPQGDSSFHRRITIPTLLVHGMNDPYITLVEECEMERTIPRSFLEILPEATHFAMQETPDELCHMIHCFITLWEKGKGLSK